MVSVEERRAWPWSPSCSLSRPWGGWQGWSRRWSWAVALTLTMTALLTTAAAISVPKGTWSWSSSSSNSLCPPWGGWQGDCEGDRGRSLSRWLWRLCCPRLLPVRRLGNVTVIFHFFRPPLSPVKGVARVIANAILAVALTLTITALLTKTAPGGTWPWSSTP